MRNATNRFYLDEKYLSYLHSTDDLILLLESLLQLQTIFQSINVASYVVDLRKNLALTILMANSVERTRSVDIEVLNYT